MISLNFCALRKFTSEKFMGRRCIKVYECQ